jgi:hypothetical protein
VNAKALHLFQTGVAPQQQYDLPVVGTSPAMLAKLRSNCLLALGVPGAQPCTTTLIRWKLEARHDPLVSETARHIAMWFSTWRARDRVGMMTKDVEKAWNRILGETFNFETKQVNWQKVRGPIGATIGALARAGWNPSRPHHWTHHHRQVEIDITQDAYAETHMIAAVEHDMDQVAWTQAASHHLGGGLQAGRPDLGPARLARKHLAKDNPRQAAALDKVVCGAAWTHGRGGGFKRACLWCGQDDTPEHRYWTCPRHA